MSLLLKNGTALIHDQDEHVRAIKTDVLIEGNAISKIDTSISHPSAEVIDCSNRIISPGFIDTHHHVWQTQLKGRHADETLLQYMASGNLTGALFNPDDVFWGQLGGCLEMLHSGTTTVADYAHINVSPAHNHAAIAATAASGIRSAYGFSPNPRLASTNPFTIDPNGLAGHTMPTFDSLAASAPWGNGRVELGLAWDGFAFTPKEYVDALMAKVDAAGIKLIQTHVSWKEGKPGMPSKLDEMGVLDGRFLMAHSSMSKADAELYRKRGVHYSSTPSTELQMSMVFPVVAFDDALGVRDLGSLGCDCHSNNAAFIPGEARLGLQSARAARGVAAATHNKTPLTVGPTVEAAFNLATLRGAHAMNLGHLTGSIAVGKRADLVVFDANSPAMVCAGVHDPVAAIILHSSPADIETVIVDGVVRKREGKLVDVRVDTGERDEVGEVGRRIIGGKGLLKWEDVARGLLETRERIQGEAEKMDFGEGVRKVMELMYIDDSELGDP